MNLSEKSEIFQWPVTHYVFVEKIGPFHETAMRAWQTVREKVPEILKATKILGGMSLYKVSPTMIYRAGFRVDSKPAQLPEGLQYASFAGGKYSRYTLRGSYANLPQASGQVFEMVKKEKIAVRDDWNIENYANDPATTPEDQLITEILIPTK